MSHLKVIEIKAFVPSRDFGVSKQFIRDLGFSMASEGGEVAYFHLGHFGFWFQNIGQNTPSET